MKKTMKLLSMAALALVGAVISSCSSNEDDFIDNAQQPVNKDNVVTLTTTVSLDGGEAGARAVTRAVDADGTKYFQAGDQIDVVYVNTSDKTVRATSVALTAGDITNSGKSANFTVTLTNPKTGVPTSIRYFYPAGRVDAEGNLDFSWLGAQDGTIEGLSSNEDICYNNSDSWYGESLPALTLTNYLTIGKFTIKNPSGTAINDDLTSVTISDGSNTYTITPTGSTFTDDPIWVAMRPISAGTPVTVTATDGTNNYSKSITIASGKDLLAGKIYPINVTMALVPTGAINGLFTVNGSGDQVYFSKGNLQAVCASADADGSTQETWTWQFAEHQYDYIGGCSFGGSEPQTGNNYINGDGSISTASTVDLFGWSTNDNYYGIHNRDNDYTYSGDFNDWGNNITGWRTLTKDEWGYLFNTRTNAASKFGYATVGGTHGIIILPDDFTDPMKNNGSDAFFGSTTTGWGANVYTAGTNWDAMEDAGAVFLPAAGVRPAPLKNYVMECEAMGLYWSSVPTDDNNPRTAYLLIFQPDLLEPEVLTVAPETYTPINAGCSVRLVKDAN